MRLHTNVPEPAGRSRERASPSREILGFVAWVSMILIVLPVMAQSSSTNYVLQQSTLDAAGEASLSTSYSLTASLGQELAVGTSSAPTYVLQSGFWSFVGSGLVPVILGVDKNVSTPGNVDLFWSGNNPPYDIYQSVDCSAVFASFYNSTSGNDYLNIPPPANDLVCYNVLATAPGPPPPEGAPSNPQENIP